LTPEAIAKAIASGSDDADNEAGDEVRREHLLRVAFAER
jgi:hypothetical protein